MISIKSLNINYYEKNILKDISIDIDSDMCILGANGSGKSTLAKAICGLISYDGEILLDKEDIKKLSFLDRAKLISYIPAKLEVYDSFITVEEFVLLSRFSYKKNFLNYSKEDKKIAFDALEFLNISHLKSHTLNSLSSGEAQLTLMASALTQQSKIIILDEPTANLDPYNSKIIAQHIKGLKQNHQVILITHDLHLASYVNSPILFIKDSNISYFKDGFFEQDILNTLYGVEFNNLAVNYE